MKPLRLITAFLAVLFFWGGVHAATHSGCIEGSGIVKSETREVDTFRGIDVSGAYDVEATCGETLRVVISADDNLLPHIRTRVEDGVLFIDSDKAFCTRNRLKATISVPTVERISLSGAIDLSIRGVNNADLAVSLSGSGSVRASGKTGSFTAEASGASTIDARELRSKKVRAKISGACEAVIHAEESLDAEISGAGELIYYGDPARVSRRISGAGELIKK